MNKPRGLFVNTAKARCSIYESGLMIYKSLQAGNSYQIEYHEIDKNIPFLPGGYDYYAFNYHHDTMGWLKTSALKNDRRPKITFVLEVLTNNPFVYCPENDFDAYCVLDPTIDVVNKRVYAFPRPLEQVTQQLGFNDSAIPIIGTFGFATPGKGFELVVDAVNREFDQAIIKINIPPDSFANAHSFKLQNRDYFEYLSELCQKVAKPGIQVEITRHYFSKDDLIKWCAKNTLNCFLYDRMQPGLSATTDQAITSGRPLAVSTNETFRHILQYLIPYPFKSLRDSIETSVPGVLAMQQAWSLPAFSACFEKVLDNLGLFKENVHSLSGATLTISKINLLDKAIKRYKRLYTNCDARHRSKSFIYGKKFKDNIKARLLIVSHKKSSCGIYHYGKNTFDALIKSTYLNVQFSECSNGNDLSDAFRKFNPDVILYNYYPHTMPWLTPSITRRYKRRSMAIMHEVTEEEADRANNEMFDFYICPDPTLKSSNPIVIKIGRLIPPYINMKPLPNKVTIGSFGFGFGDKGFGRIIQTVQEQFDEAIINFHLPSNSTVPKGRFTNTYYTAFVCRRIVKKPGIKLKIRHGFLCKEKLLDFLASNTLNAFFYDVNKNRGISSTIEHALAVKRPVAVNRCGMFRHVHGALPSICIEDRSFQEIISSGISPLVPFYTDWSEAQFIKRYEEIFVGMNVNS